MENTGLSIGGSRTSGNPRFVQRSLSRSCLASNEYTIFVLANHFTMSLSVYMLLAVCVSVCYGSIATRPTRELTPRSQHIDPLTFEFPGTFVTPRPKLSFLRGSHWV